MGIKSRCTECGSESTGTGAIVHATTCTANLFIPQTGTGIRYPGTTLIFDTPEEQAKFMKSLKGQVGGTGLRLEDSSQDEGTVTSPKETIEDKLREILWDFHYDIDEKNPNENLESLSDAVDKLQAIITTETTNARINTLQELQPCDDHYDSKAVHLEDITAHIAALQEEQL